MADETTLILVGTALAGLAAVVQHFYDRFATNGLYNRSSRSAADAVQSLNRLPTQIGSELKDALRAVAVEQEANIGSAAEDAVDPLLPKLDDLPGKIGVELEAALNRVAERQRAEIEAEAKKLETSAAMSMVRSVGVDRQAQAKISAALSEAILGPALPILRQFAPGLADTLEENPQLVDVVINNPLFKKYIEPRIQQFLGSQQGGHLSVDKSGWGT